jgi:hypothetical protein
MASKLVGELSNLHFAQCTYVLAVLGPIYNSAVANELSNGFFRQNEETNEGVDRQTEERETNSI